MLKVEELAEVVVDIYTRALKAQVEQIEADRDDLRMHNVAEGVRALSELLGRTETIKALVLSAKVHGSVR